MTGISPIGSVWPTQASINTKPTLDLKAFTPDGDTVVLSEKASDEIRSQFGKADSSDKHLTPGTQAALAAAARGDYYWTDSSGGRCFSAITTLTKADKELVKNATGWDINADPEALTASEAAKSFAGRLNLDRYSRLVQCP